MSIKKVASKNVVTISPKTTILDAAKQMRELHVGDVIVVHEEGGKRTPVGILTDRDITVSVTAFGVDPSSVYVEDVMGPTVAVAKTTDSFYQVLSLMKEHGIKRVPLVSPAGALEGIITSDDIIETLASELGDVAKIVERQKAVEMAHRRKFA